MIRRIAKWGCWCGLVLLILTIAAWTIANAVGQSRMEKRIAALREEGFAITLHEMAPPPAPPDTNAAPFYTVAFALLADPTGVEKPFDQAVSGEYRTLPPDQKAELRKWLAKNAECFEFLRRARSRPRCRFERPYILGQGFDIPLPEIAKVIRVCKILSFRAEAETEEGKGDEARETVRDALAAAQSLREDPFLVSQLVRILCLGWVFAGVENCVNQETAEQDLRGWLQILPRPEEFHGMMEQPMRAELATVAESLARGTFWKFTEPGIDHRNTLREWALTPLVKLDGAQYLDEMKEFVRRTGYPYWDARREVDRTGKGMEAWLSPVRAALLPALDRCLENQTTLQATSAVLRAGLECEIARVTTGKYPERIDTPDPFTGKPLLYERNVRIASAGPSREPAEWKLRKP